MSMLRGAVIGSLSGVRLFQRRTFLHRDVVGLVALDFILWIIRARVMRVSLVIGIFCMTLRILPLTWPDSEFQFT